MLLRFSYLAIFSSAMLTVTVSGAAADNDVSPDHDTLNLDQLIVQVLQHNPLLRQRKAEVDASVARIIQAKALDDPRLSYTAAPQTANLEGKDFGQKIMLSQKLPWPGKRKLAARSWRQETEAKREQISTARLDLAKQAADAFVDWYLAHAAQVVNDKRKALWREFQHLAEFNYSAGKAGKQDVLEAEVGYYRLQHRDINLQKRRSDARTRINRLLNQPTDTPQPSPPKMLKVPTPPEDIHTLLRRALADRPKTQSISYRVAAAGSRIQQAKLEDYPDISLNVGWNSLWDLEEKRWTIGVSINLPLDGEKRAAARDQARAEQIRLRAQRDGLLADIAAEVQTAYDGLIEARHEMALYRDKLLPTVREALEASRTDYRSGYGDFLSLINAEQNLHKIELGALEARVSAFRQHTELMRSLGLTESTSIGNPNNAAASSGKPTEGGRS